MTESALQTTAAETLVGADPTTVFAAVNQLVAILWPEQTEVIASSPPCQLVHTVRTDPGSDDVAAWLTWELMTSASDCRTRVRLVHDELDTSSGPAPELDAVLEHLIAKFGTGTPRGAERPMPS